MTKALPGIKSIDIYFHQNNADEHQSALELRDAVLRLRRDGAFVAVPLFRINTAPIGPHPVGEPSCGGIAYCPQSFTVTTFLKALMKSGVPPNRLPRYFRIYVSIAVSSGELKVRCQTMSKPELIYPTAVYWCIL